ncbi:hypothetical protein RJT34_15486 [Clitoria ternatea]|uniref:Uncharacterized protein n=1 Tax=Clitoria ternatea TaxID=43366 RepID=A0AAN9J5I2_CLITE
MVDAAKKLYAIVTGGNKGIGFEVCKQLASNGITVLLTARDEKRGLEAVDKLKHLALSDQVVFHQLDVTDPASISSLANFIKTHFGKLDILVCLALHCHLGIPTIIPMPPSSPPTSPFNPSPLQTASPSSSTSSPSKSPTHSPVTAPSSSSESSIPQSASPTIQPSSSSSPASLSPAPSSDPLSSKSVSIEPFRNEGLRSFNSYPDLRQLVPTDEHFHFHNDTSLFPREQKPRLDFEEDHDIGIENVAVAPSQSPPPTPPEHQSEVVRGNV